MKTPKTYLKNLFTPGFVFLCILCAIIGIFVVSSADVILSKVGFETPSVLKAKISTYEADVKRLAETNQENAKNLLIERKQNLLLKEELKKLSEVKNRASEEVQIIQERKQKRSIPVLKVVKEKQVINQHTITIPLKETDQLSSLNYDQISAAYKNLFST